MSIHVLQFAPLVSVSEDKQSVGQEPSFLELFSCPLPVQTHLSFHILFCCLLIFLLLNTPSSVFSHTHCPSFWPLALPLALLSLYLSKKGNPYLFSLHNSVTPLNPSIPLMGAKSDSFVPFPLLSLTTSIHS